MWGPSSQEEISSWCNPKTQRTKDHKVQRKTLSWRGQIQDPVAIQLNSGTCIIYGIISKSMACWPPWPTYSANSPNAQQRSQTHTTHVQKCLWAGDKTLDPGLAGGFALSSVSPSLPRSHSHCQWWHPLPRPREALGPGSFHSGRQRT